MKNLQIGLQLYSIRREMERDMDAALRAVAEMGYTCVQFAGYFGKSAGEVRALCDKHGLDPVSSHEARDALLDDPEGLLPYLKTLGVSSAGIAWIPPDDWNANYGEIVRKIRSSGKLLADNGIRLLYHNHEFEFFLPRGDGCVLDALYHDVPPEYLQPELDLAWVHYAGKDPVEYVKKYGAVSEIIHIKDFECANLPGGPLYELIRREAPALTEKRRRDRKADGFEFRAVGHGRQDMKAIMRAIEASNVRCVIVEQDDPAPGHTELEDAKASIDYLRSIGY